MKYKVRIEDAELGKTKIDAEDIEQAEERARRWVLEGDWSRSGREEFVAFTIEDETASNGFTTRQWVVLPSRIVQMDERMSGNRPTNWSAEARAAPVHSGMVIYNIVSRRSVDAAVDIERQSRRAGIFWEHGRRSRN